jgi:hypothetical protein
MLRRTQHPASSSRAAATLGPARGKASSPPRSRGGDRLLGTRICLARRGHLALGTAARPPHAHRPRIAPLARTPNLGARAGDRRHVYGRGARPVRRGSAARLGFLARAIPATVTETSSPPGRCLSSARKSATPWARRPRPRAGASSCRPPRRGRPRPGPAGTRASPPSPPPVRRRRATGAAGPPAGSRGAHRRRPLPGTDVRSGPPRARGGDAGRSPSRTSCSRSAPAPAGWPPSSPRPWRGWSRTAPARRTRAS